jgi:ribonuclease-3 family protein
MYDLFVKTTPEKARQLSGVTLAFVGDAVYSLLVRANVVAEGDRKLIELQKITSSKVSAEGQSKLLETIESRFTEEEEGVYHRARNAKKSTKSKNASVVDYNRSTGFEAVLGYLYLCGRYDRIKELFSE